VIVYVDSKTHGCCPKIWDLRIDPILAQPSMLIAETDQDFPGLSYSLFLLYVIPFSLKYFRY